MPTAAAQSGMSYPGSRTPPDAPSGAVPLGSPGASSAARNGATYPDVLVDLPPTSSTHPATWNGAAYTEWLAAHLSSSSSGGTPHHQAVHEGAPYLDTDGLMTQLRSPTAPWNAVAYPDVLTAHLAAPDVSPPAWNHGAYPGVAVALDTNALGCVTGEGAAATDLGFERLRRPTDTAAAATERSGGYYYYHHHSGDMALPFAAQVVVDEAEDSDSLVKDSAIAEQREDLVAAGAVAEPVRGGGGHVGVGGQLGAAAITLAVAGLTAGGEDNASTALPLFLMLITGVTLVTVRVARG